MIVDYTLTMAGNNGSYSNDRASAGTDVEFATDPASGSFFNSDYKKLVFIFSFLMNFFNLIPFKNL